MQYFSGGATAFQCRVTVKPQGILLLSILHSPSGHRAARTNPFTSHLESPAATQNAPCWGAVGSEPWGLHSSRGCSSVCCAHQPKHRRDGPTHPLCVSYFSFPANQTFNMRSWTLSELFQSLAPENLRDWAKLLNEDGSQLLSSSGDGSGQEDAKWNPPPLQGSKKHHYWPHSKVQMEAKFLWLYHHQQRWHQGKPNKVNKQSPQHCRVHAPQHCSVRCVGHERAVTGELSDIGLWISMLKLCPQRHQQWDKL